MRIAVLASYAPSLINFRGPLLRSLTRAGHEVFASAPDIDESIRSKLEALGANPVLLPLSRRGLNPLGDLRYVAAVRTLLRSIQPDAVLSYTIKPVIFGSFGARLAGVPMIASMITGLGYTFVNGGGFKGRLLTGVSKSLYRSALRFNKKVFFQNPDDQEFFISNRLVSPQRALRVNGSGIDLDYFAKAPLPSGPVTFLLIARLLKSKGVAEYLRAARLVKERFPESRFKLAGPYEAGADSISATDLEPAIKVGDLEYLGELDDVRPALRETTVYVLPSYREGTPRTVLEALAVGRPVITTNVPGCRETVVESYNGFLVPARDHLALADRMTRFIQQPALINEFASNGRRLVEERFDVNEVNRRILDALGIAASETPGGPPVGRPAPLTSEAYGRN